MVRCLINFYDVFYFIEFLFNTIELHNNPYEFKAIIFINNWDININDQKYIRNNLILFLY